MKLLLFVWIFFTTKTGVTFPTRHVIIQCWTATHGANNYFADGGGGDWRGGRQVSLHANTFITDTLTHFLSQNTQYHVCQDYSLGTMLEDNTG